jgi:Rhodopirellula transposase DDE domain/Helix-turn-helix of DDE superfamily endonuclease
MNWRGRPLTSHEVIVNTIAATTTRTGLTVHAELDTGLYPAGARVSDQQMAALPITRHGFHGDWNYCLPPRGGGIRPGGGSHPHQPIGWDRTALAHPALTGLTRPALSELAAGLTTAWAMHREASLNQRRGADRRRAPGAGARPRLDLTDRILATLLHLRLRLPQPEIARLPGVDRTTISRTIRVTRQLLHQHGTTIEPATVRLHTLADLAAFASTAGITLQSEIKPAC